ncbi:LIM domain protein [Teladorsagia circumcincta]|uniref:LIM domain protein n=1 Tax=Teladorsagia circumcincta TaxID=45464 RepID=A0A2G9T8U0_TELCI|nr:LIM domain protein [Teladorsagia circumcincta]
MMTKRGATTKKPVQFTIGNEEASIGELTSGSDQNLSLQKTLENCHKCHQKITDRLLRAKGGVWHVNCFVCESCKRSLDGVPFTSDPENNVYCVSCYQE